MEEGPSASVVRGSWDAFQTGGIDAMAEFWHPDIEWRAMEGAADDAGVMRGRARLRRYYQDWLDTIDYELVELDEVALEEGERVVALVHTVGRGRLSGAPLEGRYAIAYTLRDGRIVSGREYGNAEDAIAASDLAKGQ
ncbi:MAG TPA: nuclear transport factor 2 family protein [Thermoleophilaceae bacterium]